MSLAHLKVEKNIFQPILVVAFITFVLVMVMLVMSTTIFARPSGIELNLASLNEASDKQIIIRVTSENVIYLDGKVVTLNDLRRYLSSGNFRGALIAIKSDRRTSMGRVSDILDLCRGIPGATVNVSTVF
jgi:biopolymer transport protein ExbD